MPARLSSILAVVVALAAPGTAPWAGARQSVAEIQGVEWRGEPAVSESIFDVMERERTAERRHIPARKYKKVRNRFPERDDLPQYPDAPRVARLPVAPEVVDKGDEAGLSVGRSFLAVDLGESRLDPPDSVGAVSPTQIVVVVNNFIRLFDKSGAVGPLSTTTNNFFEILRDGRTTGDPRVRFDRTSGRWFVTALTFAEAPFANSLLLAVSDEAEITPATRFRYFKFRAAPLLSPAPNAPEYFLDYATLGIDASALYVGAYTISLQTSGDVSTSVFVVRKSSVLGEGPPVVTGFAQVGTRERGGIFTAQGVSSDDPAATEGYFVGTDFKQFGLLRLLRVADPGGRPRIAAHVAIPVPATSRPRIAPTGETSGGLTPIDDRLFGASLFLDRRTGERTLWTAHSVETDALGVAVGGKDRTAARWYEIADLATSPTVRQAGTLLDPATRADALHVTFPTVAMSEQGHAALGCTVSGRAMFPGVAVAWRNAADPPGEIRPLVVAQPGLEEYRPYQGIFRWGDYSMTLVDPADGMTFWTFQEYALSQDTWGVRVVEIKAPPPPPLRAGATANVAVGETATVTVEADARDGAGFFDPGPGYRGRPVVSASGSGVEVVRVRVLDSRRVELDVEVALAAATGSRDLTIVNPDGQSVTGVGALNVGPAVASVAVKRRPSGGVQLVVRGRGLAEGTTIAVEGVPFAAPSRATKERRLVQTGALADGRSLDEAIPRGVPVALTFTTPTGGVTTVRFTRS